MPEQTNAARAAEIVDTYLCGDCEELKQEITAALDEAEARVLKRAIDACASMRVHLKEQRAEDQNFGREYSYQIIGVNSIQESLRMMRDADRPAAQPEGER